VLVHGDLGPLIRALRQPDASPAAMCAAELVTLAPFWLVDQYQQAYRSRVPRGPCRQPSDAVVSALDALHG
jgi:hypothetical protein